MKLPDIYVKLEKIFSSKGYKLYIVGGTTRDILLGRRLIDYDFATDAKIDDIKKFLNVISSFDSVGSCQINFEETKVDITTLRIEKGYADYRHPTEVIYVDNPKEDAQRRDFTINALYLDKEGNILDYFEGKQDLKSNLIKMIGNPNIRIKEDPLRILRAIRFSLTLNFNIDGDLKNAIFSNRHLLQEIKYSKCLSEIKKMYGISYSRTIELLSFYGISEIIPIDYGFNETPLIDMHCDTITRPSVQIDGLYSNEELHIDILKMEKAHYMLQCFAVFINMANGQPFNRACSYINVFNEQMKINKQFISKVTTYREVCDAFSQNKIAALLTLEEGGILEGNISNLDYLYGQGVRMMTLTWNYPNEISYPNLYSNKKNKFDLKQRELEHGLTPFGIEVVKRMNELGMIIDVSHLSDKGFYDVAKYSNAPFVASHSDAYGVFDTGRNLTDDMIRVIKEKKGLIGINYCPEFISDNKGNQIVDIVKHIKHIKDIGGIDIIGLGSDFDGIPTPNGLSDASKLPLLKQELIKEGFTQSEIEKIFYKNFLRLLKRVCK